MNVDIRRNGHLFRAELTDITPMRTARVRILRDAKPVTSCGWDGEGLTGLAVLLLDDPDASDDVASEIEDAIRETLRG